MMKKTQFIELLNIIKSTKVSFLAIFMFVCLGVAIFAGMGWSGKAYEDSLNAEYSKYKFRDAEIVFPYGVEKDDIDKFKNLEDVKDAEPLYSSCQFFNYKEKEYQARFLTLPQKIDQLLHVQGELPNSPGETAIERRWAEENNIKIGDTIKLKHDDDGMSHFLSTLLDEQYDKLFYKTHKTSGMTHLNTDLYTVTALCDSPAYLGLFPMSYGASDTIPAQINCVMYVTEDNFDKKSFTGYSSLLLTSKKLSKLNTYTEEYRKESLRFKNDIEKLSDKISQEKLDQIEESKQDCISKFNMLEDSLEDIEDYKATVLLRNENPSYAMSVSNAKLFGKIKYNMAILFLLIGMLVSYSAISRLIINHSTLIGTKKALGFSDTKINKTYLYYAAVSALLGSISGLLVGRFIVERIFIGVLRETFIFDDIVYYFSSREALSLSLLEILLTMVIAYFACQKVLKANAIDLLNERDEKLSKAHWYEKLKSWEKISVFKKVAINNIFNDGKRIFAMLIGIAGCTTLIVCALSFNDAVINSFTRHFDKVQSFDSVVYFDVEKDGGSKEIKSVLEDNNVSYAPVYIDMGTINTPDEKSKGTELFVYKDNDTNGLFNLYSTDGQKEKIGNKAWVNCAYSKYYNLKKNDIICLTDSDTQKRNITVDDSYEYYLGRCQLIMSESSYKSSFGRDAKVNAYVFKAGSRYKSIVDELRKTDNFVIAEDYYGISLAAYKIMSSIGGSIVGVYLTLAFLMAIIIILNLLIMFIQEKKRELITLMTNGYSVKKVKKYIYYDTIILMVLGIIIGTLCGIILGQWNVHSIMTSSEYYIEDIDYIACIEGIGITIIFTVIMGYISLRRVNKFRLSDLNR